MVQMLCTTVLELEVLACYEHSFYQQNSYEYSVMGYNYIS